MTLPKTLLIFYSFLLFFMNLALATEVYWQQDVHYNFNVHLDSEKHALSGDAIITYKNNSPDTLDRIYLHLYPNAFKNENSTLAREAKRYYRDRSITPKNNGYIDILEFRITRKETAIDPTEAPVMAYRVDDTILESMLPEPLPPGGELQLYIKFYEKITSIINRGGWRGNQYDFGQWYPKLVVYDQNGWHPDQFHASGEFYGEFGTFDVAITLPYNYIVAATGVAVEGDPGWSWIEVDTSLAESDWSEAYDKKLEEIEKRGEENKERTVTFHAENVHDFAWLTSPDFLYEKGEWNGIPVHVLYRSNAREGWSKKVVQRGERVLEWLSTKFGMYPYPQLSITHGLLGGGMEYPMLVMNSGPWEGLISHEVGHIYFYGILASDELAEAWMDEGFTSYQEYWYQQTNFGPWGYEKDDIPDSASLKFKLNPKLPIKESTYGYLIDYMTSGYNEPMSQYAQDFKGGYGINAYTKGAAFFGMLHYIVGDSLWDKICHTYFDRWKFKHVNEGRFKKVVEDVTGENFDWYFDEWMRKTVVVDYGLGKISKSKLENDQWQTEVEVKRNDEGIMPVEVQLTTKNGERFTKRWDGKDKSGRIVFVTKEKPEKVVLDPDDMILDKNRLNNGNWKFQFLPDIPFTDYSPRNAYLIKYAPKMWYNDVDGFWLGARFRGSYLEKFYRTEIGATYGFQSDRVGYNFAVGHPLLPNSDKLQLEIAGINQEGRGVGNITLSYRMSTTQYLPPFHRFRLSFNTAQLFRDEEDYARRKIQSAGETMLLPEWERGRVNKIAASYNLDFNQRRWSSGVRFNVETSQDIWGSEFNFSKLEGECKFILGRSDNGFAIRLFAGNFWGDEAPVQEKFFTDGANPRERFSKFYLRSVAALPPELHYHFPGGGNLRGYIDQPLATERIVAFNTELRSALLTPLFRKLLPRRSSVRLSPFFDFARILTMDEKYQNMMDAGIGLQLNLRLFYQRFTLRFDFPVWVNEPLPGEKETKFRWVFSLQNAI
jgi:hypothetical protein